MSENGGMPEEIRSHARDAMVTVEAEWHVSDEYRPVAATFHVPVPMDDVGTIPPGMLNRLRPEVEAKVLAEVRAMLARSQPDGKYTLTDDVALAVAQWLPEVTIDGQFRLEVRCRVYRTSREART